MLPSPPAPPFVKVCGFTDPANLRAVCENEERPDAIGLNVWYRSTRHVGHATWSRMLRAAEDCRIAVWRVSVNADVRDEAGTAVVAEIAGLQLHGDEPPETLEELRERTFGYRPPEEEGDIGYLALVRAWRVQESLDPLLDYLAAAAAAGTVPDAVLLDAAVPGAYGGTGAKLDWHALRAELNRVGDRLPSVILAGGLTPENVAEAVRIVRPWGVDVAGGVESGPGVKDPAKVAAFVAAAKGAVG